MKRKSIFGTTLSLMVAGGVFRSCQQDELTDSDIPVLKNASSEACEPVACFPLKGGQNISVGDLKV